MQLILDSIMSLLTRGGWVMPILLVMSVIAVMLCIERSVFWLKTRSTIGRGELPRLTQMLRKNHTQKIHQQLQAGQSVHLRFVRYVLDHGSTESVAIEATEAVRPQFERFMTILSTIITTAPLLGILGTVVGIIGSFELLGDGKLVTDPRDVSGGIAEALLTTQVGLIITLITVFPYMIFRSAVNRTLGELEVLAAAIMEGSEHNNSTKTAEITEESL